MEEEMIETKKNNLIKPTILKRQYFETHLKRMDEVKKSHQLYKEVENGAD